MFLCRRIFLRHFASFPEPFAASTTASVCGARHTLYSLRKISPLSSRTYSTTNTTAEIISQLDPHISEAQNTEQEVTSPTSASLAFLEAHRQRHTKQGPSLKDVQPSYYLRLLRHALAVGADLSHIVEEILAFPQDRRTSIILSIFSDSALLADLPNTQATRLIQPVLRNSDHAKVLRPVLHPILMKFSRMPTTQDPPFPSVIRHLRFLIPTILSGISVPSTIDSISYTPPVEIRITFGLSRHLLALGLEVEALEVLQKLMEGNQIPPEAMDSLQRSELDFRYSLSLALARSALHWHLHGIASDFIMDLCEAHASEEELRRLAIDTIWSIMEAPDRTSLSIALKLIVKLGATVRLPAALIRKFYDAAFELDFPLLAELLYLFTRQDAVLAIQHYPPPQGLPLPWLMRHLSYEKTTRRYLSRQLAEEILRDSYPIPPAFRGQFIADVASNGYAMIARRLYEQYSSGKDGYIVSGNPALVVRLCSLFAHLTKRLEAKLRGETGPYLDNYLQGVPAEELQSRIDSISRLLDQILEGFLKHIKPLSTASRTLLTSLARAYFLVGRPADGFDVFSILLRRHETPDVYDINVALTAVAEQSPRSAARMLERLVERGINPGSVTYGAVIHAAVLHQDDDLVASLLERMKDLDVEVSWQTMDRVIRASVTHDTEFDKYELREKLQRAVKIIQELRTKGQTLSPSLGDYLISVSIRAESPVLGYQIWRLLNSLGAQWDDSEQQYIRRALKASLQAHAKGLDRAKVDRMISMLDREQPPFTEVRERSKLNAK